MPKDKPPEEKRSSGRRSGRNGPTKVKTARRRKASSNKWIERHINDPYVLEAGRLGYRSRAAFKLKEMDDKLNLIKRGMVVLDLGAAPGGWTQVAMEKNAAKVVAIDLLPMDELPGVTFLQMDFMADEAPAALLAALGGPVDLVLTDMAPNTTGHRATDHLRIMALADAAYEFAAQVLKPGGAFVAKVFQGGTQNELLQRLKKDFTTVKHIKPPASRKESAESYVAALGFRG